MTTKTSTGLRDYMLAQGSLRAALAGGKIRSFTGAEPASADAAETGTLLVEYTLNDSGTGLTLDTTSSGAVIAKVPGDVYKGTVLATGTAGYFRYVAPGDTGGLSTTERRFQGSVGVAGADMNLTSTALVMGEERTLKQFAIALPTF